MMITKSGKPEYKVTVLQTVFNESLFVTVRVRNRYNIGNT